MMRSCDDVPVPSPSAVRPAAAGVASVDQVGFFRAGERSWLARGLAVIAAFGACNGAGKNRGNGGGGGGGAAGGAAVGAGAGGTSTANGTGGIIAGSGGRPGSDVGGGGGGNGSGGNTGSGGGAGGASMNPNNPSSGDARLDQASSPDSSTSMDATSDAEPPSGRPSSCDRLRPLPVPYKVKRGPKAAEDFTFDRAGNLISVDERSGSLFKSPFNGKPVLFAPTRFVEAAGTRMLPSGDLVVAEVGGGALYRVSPTGTKSRLASGFVYPNGIEVHLDGSVFVADQTNRRVVKVDPTTGASTIFISGPLLGAPNGVTFSPDYRRCTWETSSGAACWRWT